MLWEYKTKFMGRILDKTPKINDFSLKNFKPKYIQDIRSGFNYEKPPWIYGAIPNCFNTRDWKQLELFHNQKPRLVEVERLITKNSYLSKLNKIYLKMVITIPTLNNQTTINWVYIDWVTPFKEKTPIEEIKEVFNEIKRKKYPK